MVTADDARPVPGPSILDHFSLSPEQRLAAGERGRDVAVTAGAGTGKTRTLVARYLSLLDDLDGAGDSLRQVIAITFTRKAAREMRGRVRKEIGLHLDRLDGDGDGVERWQAYYRGLDAARIDTIHTLCGEILRRHPAEAGIDPRFDVLDEAAAALLTAEAVDDALAWAAVEPAMSPLFEWLGERDLRELAVKLARERLKTAEIVGRVPARGIAHHWQATLRDAQSAALQRFEGDEGVRQAAAVLRDAQPLDPQDKMAIQRALALDALDAQGGTLETVLAGRRRLLEINRIGGRQATWRGGAAELGAVKRALQDLKERWEADAVLGLEWNPLDEALAGASPALYDFFDRVDAFYQARKTELGALDFDDLEARALLLLERPDVVAVWERDVRALLVDEFQDTNERQRMLVRRLCPRPGRLFIVGDAKQSIYRFRGADVAVFESEQVRIEREGGRLVNLDVSYRAHDHLLDGMNRLLRPVLGEPGDGREAWETPFAPLRPPPEGRGRAAALPPPFIEFHLTVGNKKEAMKQAAAALAARLNELVATDRVAFGDVAILCRATGSFAFYEDALDAAGIPYVTVAGKGFYDRPEIRELLNALRAIDDPHDDLALVGLLRSPVFGLSDASIYHLVRARQGQTLWESLDSAWLPDSEQQSRLAEAIGHVSELNDLAGRVPVADVLKQFLDRTHYRAIARLAGRPRALRNIGKLLSDVHRSELVGVGRFLDYVQGLRDSGSREGEARAEAGNAVQILSIHAAKGLEFPIVVLGDAASGRRNGRIETLLDPALGILPALGDDDGESGRGRQKTRGAIYRLARIMAERQEAAERKRLLYVALTRAQERLLISGHGRLNANGLGWDGWLGDLWPIAGLDADSLRPVLDGDGCHVLDGHLEGTEIRAHVYGRAFVPVATRVRPTTAETDLPGWDPALLEPLPAGYPPDAPDGPRRLWLASPRADGDTAPAWVVGKLAHQALALWKNPDAAFDAWAEARCREVGLIGPAPLRDAVRRVRLTLERFRRTDLYRRMDAAEVRRHEVPYAREVDGRVEIGYIDALFRDDGVWTVVDFKTDRPASGETIDALLRETDYTDQARRYGEAVVALLGERPRLLLCFLGAEDADGQAVVVPVDPGP